MAGLTFLQKKILEDIFIDNGYVPVFRNNDEFSKFFLDYDIDIDDEKYMIYGTSKGNRLRAFWKIDSDRKVSIVMLQMLALKNYAQCPKNKQVGQAEEFLKKLQDRQSEAPANKDHQTLQEWEREMESRSPSPEECPK